MNRSKSQSNRPHFVSLDAGYGYVKAIAIGRDPVIFPSVIGEGRDLRFQADKIREDYPGDQVMVDDRLYFVGRLAQSQLPANLQLRLRGRMATFSDQGKNFRRILLIAALAKLFSGLRASVPVEIILSTGLPVDHMSSAADLRELYTGSFRVETDDTDFIAVISRVYVMPQPTGTMYSLMIQADGQLNPCYVARRTAIIDVGTFTTDITVDDDGEYISGLSGSIASGTSTAQEMIATWYEDRYVDRPDLRTIEQILQTGCSRIHGIEVDFSEWQRRAVQPLRDAVVNFITERWGAATTIDAIYLAGGGALLIADSISRVYPNVTLLEDAQMTNARGYLNFALFKAGQGS